MTQLEKENKQLKAQIEHLKKERIKQFEKLASWHESLARQYQSIVDVYNGNTRPWAEVLNLLKRGKCWHNGAALKNEHYLLDKS